MGVLARVRALANLLPEGRALPAAEWRVRHRAIIAIALAHAALLPVYGAYQGYGVLHVLLEGGVLLAVTLLAAWPRASRTARESCAALALVVASSIVVHFSGGTIEAHFHFFVILGLIALYQSWVPFLLAIAFVALDHGVIGTLAPEWVYNHPDAFAHPWKWATIHAAFVLAESVALMAMWKLTENASSRTDMVLESAGEGILGTDEDGAILFANPAAAKLAGQPVDAMLGKPLQAYLPALHEARHAETAFRAAGSADVPVEFDSNPMLRNGVAIGTVVTVKDIRERKKAQTQLSQTVSTLAATLESTTDGIVVIDRAGEVRHYNQRFLEIWRIPFDVLALGQSEEALRSAADKVVDPDAFIARIRELEERHGEETFDTLQFKDGRIIERYSRPQRLPDGGIVGRVWSFRDVTERKRAEAAALASRVSRPMARMMIQAIFSDKKGDVATLMRVGYDVAAQVEAADVPGALDAYASMGLGALRVTHWNAHRHEFEGDDLFERAPEATASTTCHLALGFLCGTVTRITGERARGTEISCQSRGDPTCRFVVSTKHAESR